MCRYNMKPWGLVLLTFLSWSCPAFAQEATTPGAEDKSQLLEKAQAARRDAAQAREAGRQHQEEVQRLQKELASLKQSLAELDKKIEQNAQSTKSAEQELVKQQEVVKAVEITKTKADQAAIDAKKAFEEARKRMEEADKNAATAAKGLDDARKLASDYDKKLTELKSNFNTLSKQVESARGKMTEFGTKLPPLELAIADARKQQSEKDREFETLMRQSGEWVSFASQIAPIFQGRCVACHQTKTAKGQFSLETYAALMKGGESGPALEPDDPQQSSLIAMLEDGSMPKDADPLTAEQIALIRQWVSLGARLDAHVPSHLPLIRIMPRPVQPPAPDRYTIPLPITAMAVHHSGTLLATSGYHEVLLWSLPEGKLVRRLGNLAERIYDLAFQPGGDLLAVASGTPGELGEVKLFQAQEGTLQRDLFITTDSMLTVRFSPDGGRLAAAGAHQEVNVFDVASGNELLTIQDHNDWVQGLAWSPDGKRIATASRDKSAKVFDAETGEQLVAFSGHSDTLSDVAFSGDGTTLISSGKDQRLRVWKAADGAEVRSLTGFGDDVPRFTLLSDGTVATASNDRRARLHQLADGKALKTFEGSPVSLFCLSVTPDGKQVIAGGADGHVRVWNIESAKLELDWVAAPPEPLPTTETSQN